jgi:hypothetical protein
MDKGSPIMHYASHIGVEDKNSLPYWAWQSRSAIEAADCRVQACFPVAQCRTRAGRSLKATVSQIGWACRDAVALARFLMAVYGAQIAYAR